MKRPETAAPGARKMDLKLADAALREMFDRSAARLSTGDEDPVPEVDDDQEQVPPPRTMTNLLNASAERMFAAQKRKLRAEDRRAAGTSVLEDAGKGMWWRGKLVEGADSFEHSELELYKIGFKKKEGGDLWVSAALANERGPAPPKAGARSKYEFWRKKANRIARLAAFFGVFTWETLTEEVVAKYWELLSANFGEVEGRDYLSYGTIQGDLRLLKASLLKLARDVHLNWTPHIPIPSERVVRSAFLLRSEIARLLLATRGHVWDPEKEDWARDQLIRKGKPVLRADGSPILVRSVNKARKRRFRGIGRLILLCLYTGTRHEAALAMHWSPHLIEGDIHLSKMEIRRAGAEAQKTSKNMRSTSRICGPFRAHVRCWGWADKVGKKGEREYVIRQFRGGAYLSYVGRQFAVVVEAAGLDPDIVLHSLRHTAATWFAVLGMPMHVSAGLLGMGLETLMDVYLHWSAQTQENADFYWRREGGGRAVLYALKKAPAERRRPDKDTSPRPGRVRAIGRSKRDQKIIDRSVG